VAIKLKISITKTQKYNPRHTTKALFRNSIVVVKQIFVLELNSLTAKLKPNQLSKVYLNANKPKKELQDKLLR
jgi:hypothetical protein